MSDKKYTHCNVCGVEMGPDRLHVLIDNGRVMRHTYACRKHRYVIVEVRLSPMDLMPIAREVQQRTDSEIEALAWAFSDGKLAPGWE